MEDAVLQEAQRSLSDQMEEQIARETGLTATLSIILEPSQTGIQVVRVEVCAPEANEQERARCAGSAL